MSDTLTNLLAAQHSNSVLQGIAILGFALAEALAIFGLVLAFVFK